MKKERNQYKNTLEFLTQLHDDLEFEIYTNLEQRLKTSPRLLPSTVTTVDFPKLQQLNSSSIKRGIWFTPNSMKNGKRSKAMISRLNVIPLENDFKGTRSEIKSQKNEYLKIIKSLQLKPSVIIESKNGYHMYWLLAKGAIIEIDQYEALQLMMQEKLKTDKGAIGAERLFRLPGFHHWKDENDPFLCETIHVDYSKRYSFEELVHKYGGQKKFSSLKRKKAIGKYSGKPINLADFKVTGNIENIFSGCHVFSALKTKKDSSHNERLGLLWTLINLGNGGLEVLRDIAPNWNDYDEEVTEGNIEYACNKGYRASTCDWFIKKGICTGRCINIRQYRKPIDLYYHPVNKLPQPSGKRTFFPTQNLSLTDDHKNVTDDIVITFKGLGQDVSKTHKNTLLTVAKVMSMPLYNDRPLVIPAYPGFGKTSLIIAYIKYMLEHKPGFGAVIVVERQDTIEEITEKINRDKTTG